MTKKIMCHIFFHNKLIFEIHKFHTHIGGEIKKFMEILFIMAGLGLIQMASKTEFVFTGFSGFIKKFHGIKSLSLNL